MYSCIHVTLIITCVDKKEGLHLIGVQSILKEVYRTWLICSGVLSRNITGLLFDTNHIIAGILPGYLSDNQIAFVDLPFQEARNCDTRSVYQDQKLVIQYLLTD